MTTSSFMQILSGILRARFGRTSNPKLKYVNPKNLLFLFPISLISVPVASLEIVRKIVFGMGCLRISWTPTPIPGNKIKHQVKIAQTISPKK